MICFRWILTSVLYLSHLSLLQWAGGQRTLTRATKVVHARRARRSPPLVFAARWATCPSAPVPQAHPLRPMIRLSIDRPARRIAWDPEWLRGRRLPPAGSTLSSRRYQPRTTRYRLNKILLTLACTPRLIRPRTRTIITQIIPPITPRRPMPSSSLCKVPSMHMPHRS